MKELMSELGIANYEIAKDELDDGVGVALKGGEEALSAQLAYLARKWTSSRAICKSCARC